MYLVETKIWNDAEQASRDAQESGESEEWGKVSIQLTHGLPIGVSAGIFDLESLHSRSNSLHVYM